MQADHHLSSSSLWTKCIFAITDQKSFRSIGVFCWYRHRRRKYFNHKHLTSPSTMSMAGGSQNAWQLGKMGWFSGVLMQEISPFFMEKISPISHFGVPYGSILEPWDPYGSMGLLCWQTWGVDLMKLTDEELEKARVNQPEVSRRIFGEVRCGRLMISPRSWLLLLR